MADKTVSLKIKVAPTADSKKALDNLNKISTNWDKVFGPNGDKPVKNQKRDIDTLSKAWANLGKEIKLARENFEGGFAAGSKSLSGLKTFTGFIDGATKKVFNLKNAIAATAIGAGAIWLGKSIFEEGAQQIKTRKRIQREFGTYGGDLLTGNARRINFAAGLQDDEAARGLIPLAEQLEAIQEGAQFRGMKRPLSVMQADTLKRKNLTFGANLLRRVSTLAPDIEPEELGRVLGDALAGPEGVRSLISTLGLSKRSKTLSQANEKGQVYKVLTPEERKKYGITKAGQYLEQGDLVSLALDRSGMTDKAAADEQKTFSHQVRQIKSTLMDQIGDIGSGALDTLTEKLGQGATAAERLQSYLASKEGKQTIDSIKDTVVSIVEGVAGIAKQLPAIGAWLKEHKTLLEVLAGAYVAAKAAPAVAGVVGGVKAVASGVSTAATVGKYALKYGKYAAGAAGGTAALVGLAGTAAVVGAHYGAKYLDDHTQFYDKLVGGGQEDAAGEAKNRTAIEILKAKREALSTALERGGVSHGLAVRYAEHPEEAAANPLAKQIIDAMQSRPIELTSTTNLVVDGQVLAKVIDKHMTRNVQNRTAGGAAPVTRE
jgi:hypothetical protein